MALEQDFTSYYDNDDSSYSDGMMGMIFTVFMIVMAYMLMIKLLTTRMSLRLMLMFLLRWLLVKWVQGE